MKKYKEVRCCKACGKTDLHPVYFHKKHTASYTNVLRRSCSRCKTVWDEETLDTPEKKRKEKEDEFELLYNW